MQVDGDVYAWLSEHSLVKSRPAGGGRSASANAGLQPLPAHVTATLLSGEAFVKLLNGIFAKHGLKQTVSVPPGDDRYQTWLQVSKGLHRLGVELDDEPIQELASGDVAIVAELLGEVHQVYKHWAATEARSRRRNQAERRAQPQQGGGYANSARGGTSALGSPDKTSDLRNVRGTPCLYYFSFAGRGELTRLIATVGGLQLDDAPELSDTHVYGSTGTLPCLSHGNLKVAQSFAIESYVSSIAPRFSRLTQANRAVDDMLCRIKEDMLKGFEGILKNALADESYQATAAEEAASIGSTWFPVVEARLPSRGFLHGLAFPTAGDLAVLNMAKAFMPFGAVYRMAGYDPSRRYRKFAAHAARVASFPAVKAYLAKSKTLDADPYRLKSQAPWPTSPRYPPSSGISPSAASQQPTSSRLGPESQLDTARTGPSSASAEPSYYRSPSSALENADPSRDDGPLDLAPPAAPPPIAARAPVIEKPVVSIEALLSNLSAETELESATSAPELLGLSMLRCLRVSPAQVRKLLSEDARRLGRELADGNAANVVHIVRWLQSLYYYCGALAELLLMRPEHVNFILGTLAHGFHASSPLIANWICRIMAEVCGGLAAGRLGAAASKWLLETSALRDLSTMLSNFQVVQSPTASLIFNCCGQSLLPVLSQSLKQVSRGEQEYLTTVHLIMRSLLAQQEAMEACMSQAVVSHFLARCVQRLGDDRSAAGTQQVAALFATDLWLASVANKGSQHQVVPEGVGELLSALKRASQNASSPTLRLVSFSCLSMLLGALCGRCDPENTPAVYRTFVYALVETDDAAVRDFATRNLMELMRRYDGMPVGILVEPMMKKIQTASLEEPMLTVIDIELFLVIAKHPRCTAKHAEMLAQVLGRVSVENADFGRSATVPLLAILQRFSSDEVIVIFFERFLQIVLSRLIQKGTPKAQTTLIHEALAKIACLRKPRLGAMLIQMLGDISRAYLMNFEALHPNLRALLELFPSEDAAVDDWAKLQFVPEEEKPVLNHDDSNMVLRSVSPSLHSEAQGKSSAPGLTSPQKDSARAASVAEESANFGSPSDPDFVDPSDPVSDEAALPQSARDRSVSFGQEGAEQVNDGGGVLPGDDNSSVRQLVQETDALRYELEKARERQLQSVEEAKALRNQLEEAKKLQQQVGKEVSELQQRRGDILARQGDKREPGAKRERGSKQAASAPAEADVEKAKLLVEAFQGPLQVLFNMYGKSKRAIGGASMPIDGLERLLTDMELMPSMIPKKAVAEAVRAARPRSRDEFQFHEFLPMVPHLAGKAFAPDAAIPFTDFGVPVPVNKDSPALCQVQAFLQHFGQLVQTSKNNSISAARPVFAESLRQWVYNYAQSVLDDLNGRLQKGEELKAAEIPEGFEILFRVPDPIYGVPEGLPIPASEKHCVEILDSILASAVGVHFLEPTAKASGPVPLAAVKGHEKLAELAVEPSATLNPSSAQSSPQRDQQQPNRQRGGRGRRRQRERPPPSEAPPQQRDAVAERQPRRGPRQQQPRPPRDERAPREERPAREDRPANEARRQSPRRQAGGQDRAPLADRRAPERPARPARQASPQEPDDRTLTPVSPGASPRRQPRRPPAPKRGAGEPAPKREASPAPKRGAAPAPKREASPAPGGGNAAPPERGSVRGSKGGGRNSLVDRAAEAQLVKERQNALQDALQSAEVKAVFKKFSAGMSKTFEFFSQWKGGRDGSMQLAGFFLFGQCFGILDKDKLKFVHRQAGGQGLNEDQFPESLLLCSIKQVELGLGGAKIPLAEEMPMWTKTLRSLCQHMLLGDSKALRAQLDSFRRTSETQMRFEPDVPAAEANADKATVRNPGAAEAAPTVDDTGAVAADAPADAPADAAVVPGEDGTSAEPPADAAAAAADGDAKAPEGEVAGDAAAVAEAPAGDAAAVGSEGAPAAAAELAEAARAPAAAADDAAAASGEAGAAAAETAPDAAAEPTAGEAPAAAAAPEEGEKAGEAAPAAADATAAGDASAAADEAAAAATGDPAAAAGETPVDAPAAPAAGETPADAPAEPAAGEPAAASDGGA